MNEEVANVYAQLKLDTDGAKSELAKFAAKASGTEVKVTAKPDDKSLSKFAEAFTGKGAASKGARTLDTALKGITGGVNGLMGALKGLGGALGTVAIAVTAVLLLMKGTDTLSEMMKSLANIFDTIQEALAPCIALLGDILIPIIDLVARIIKPIAEILNKTLAPVLEAIALVVDVVLMSLEPLLTILEGWSGVLEPLMDLTRLALIPLMQLTELMGQMEPITTALADAFQFLADVLDSVVGWIFDMLGMKRERDTITTGRKQEGTSSSLDKWEVSSADSIAKNTSQTTSELKKVVEELRKSGATEDEISQQLQDIYGMTERQVDALLLSIAASERPSGVFGGLGADKDLGFGAGLFTSKGRWGDGYQAGDILGSIVDFSAGLIGKGWLWEDGGTLPLYKNGGDIGAQIWGMNEAGNPEFLFNSGGYDSVINANALEEAMYNALKRAGIKEKSLIVKADGQTADARQLARWLLPALKLEWRD